MGTHHTIILFHTKFTSGPEEIFLHILFICDVAFAYLAQKIKVAWNVFRSLIPLCNCAVSLYTWIRRQPSPLCVLADEVIQGDRFSSVWCKKDMRIRLLRIRFLFISIFSLSSSHIAYPFPHTYISLWNIRNNFITCSRCILPTNSIPVLFSDRANRFWQAFENRTGFF